MIPNSILPQSEETEKESKEEDKIINLKELAGADYQTTPSGPVDEGNVQDMPVPTAIASPSKEAPLIDLAKMTSEEETSGSEEIAPSVKAPSPSPQMDADFQAVTEKISKQGTKTQKHESSASATKKSSCRTANPTKYSRIRARIYRA